MHNKLKRKEKKKSDVGYAVIKPCVRSNFMTSSSCFASKSGAFQRDPFGTIARRG